MTLQIPTAGTPEQFDAVRRDERALEPLLAAVGARCQFAAQSAVRFDDGSLPVYGIDDDRVLKLYPECFHEEARTEHAALDIVDGRLPIPTPRVHAAGEVEGWQYLVMSRLAGRSLAGAWPEISDRERVNLVTTIGAALHALHDLAVPASALPTLDWSAFVSAQRASARERQRARGLDASWLDQIDDFLGATPLDAPRRALLHTEVMREHLLVDRRCGSWALTGLFDFEPAMVGAPEYEFASVGVFVTCGDASLLRALLVAYGYAPSELGPPLARRLLAYALLHRYSKLPWYLERVPPPPRVRTLEALAEHWFGC